MKMSKRSRYGWIVFLLVLWAMTAAPAGTVEASGDKNERADRQRYVGRVEAIPEGLHGTWIIGGLEVTTGPRTEFDQSQGPLAVGGCAKVDIREGVVHEIDSEPDSDCR